MTGRYCAASSLSFASSLPREALNYVAFPVHKVFVVDGAGGSQCVAVERERPSYSKLQEVLKSRKGSNAGKGWMDRLLGELTFNQNSLKRD